MPEATPQQLMAKVGRWPWGWRKLSSGYLTACYGKWKNIFIFIWLVVSNSF